MSDNCKHDDVTFTGKATALDSFHTSLAWKVTLKCNLCGKTLKPIKAIALEGKLYFLTHDTSDLTKEEKVQLLAESLSTLEQTTSTAPVPLESDDWLETPDQPNHCPGCKRELDRIPKHRPGRLAVTCCATCKAISVWDESGPHLATPDELSLIQSAIPESTPSHSDQPKH